MNSIRKYGHPPFVLALLHGGPGAAGEMRPVAEELAKEYGVLEFLQMEDTIEKLVEELYRQIQFSTNQPLVLAGYSWGAWLAVLFYHQHPELVRKIILISSGSFDDMYNVDLTTIRLNRLPAIEREEAAHILQLIHSNSITPNLFARFGQLMEKADAYDLLPEELSANAIDLNMNIFQKVWDEAKALRASGELLQLVKNIKCPIVAIHGEYDPHPLKGVEEPLSNCAQFKMTKLPKCGHTPWKEKYAKDLFFQELKKEITVLQYGY